MSTFYPSLDATGTETQLGSRSSSETEAKLLPALTILWHPDLGRLGQRTLLTPISSGRSVAVSRMAPDFADPVRRDVRPAPLSVSRLSRSPIHLRPAPDGLVIDPSGSRTRVEVDGLSADGRIEIDAGRLQDGVVLLLGGAVVLLLHEVDPAPSPGGAVHGLLGQSAGILQVRRDIQRVADLDVPVLLRGETGTGKELAANAIHAAGPRAGRAFVAVNMAAVPPTLAAAELFGAKRGAFTGADQAREGLFRRAHGGTLFLDEVGETPAEVQPLLLRALESGEVRSVGGEGVTRVDVRLVSATDLDLEAAVGDRGFRAPLFHRLAGFVLRLPPLRRRRDDLGILLSTFLRRELSQIDEAHRLEDAAEPWLAASVVARLALFRWPGNVRQLANVARGLVIANRGADHADDLRVLDELEIAPPSSEPSRGDIEHSTKARATATTVGNRKPSDIGEDELVAAMERHRFRPQAAADDLGIPRASIYDLIDRSRTLRKATELAADEIRQALDRCDQHVDTAADRLRVSAQALRRRMGKLGLG